MTLSYQRNRLILRIFSNCAKSIQKRLKLSFEKFEAQHLYVNSSKSTHFPIFQTFIQDFDFRPGQVSGMFSAFTGSGGWIQAMMTPLDSRGCHHLQARSQGEFDWFDRTSLPVDRTPPLSRSNPPNRTHRRTPARFHNVHTRSQGFDWFN